MNEMNCLYGSYVCNKLWMVEISFYKNNQIFQAFMTFILVNNLNGSIKVVCFDDLKSLNSKRKYSQSFGKEHNSGSLTLRELNYSRQWLQVELSSTWGWDGEMKMCIRKDDITSLPTDSLCTDWSSPDLVLLTPGIFWIWGLERGTKSSTESTEEKQKRRKNHPMGQ